MTHIEFLGPPGAGKTTICSELIRRRTIYGGTKQDAVRRVFLKKVDPKYALIYQMLPNLLKSYIEGQYIEYRLGNQALEQFIINYPSFVKAVAAAMESVSYEPEKIFTMCKRAAEIFQLGTFAIENGEILCMDEGFAQKAFSILWRSPDDKFTLDEFFKNTPIPKLLVHIDAPTDVCLKRQRERGVFSVGREWESQEPTKAQQKLRDICFQIGDYFRRESSTSVITVENTEDIESAVQKIRRQI